ncbi:hypothetical protein [Micromonospora lutea]|uniref:hypothetical protein n=1 Tax=Micromonospora lutea TaxID=419825 RepID=UPI00194DF55D|nr:hypothetical protein [Micromonospora lutea]
MNSSPGGSWRHNRLVSDLRATVAATLEECPLGSQWVLRKDGDSMTIAVPSAVSKEEVIGEFPPRLDRWLRRSNAGRTPETQLRVRMAVTHGDVIVEENELVGGPALVEAARIRDIAPLRRAMTAAPDAFVGLVLADHVYRNSVRDGDPALMPRAYREVVAEAKGYRAPAWIRLWGVEHPTEDASADRGTDSSHPTPKPVAADAEERNAGPPSGGDTYNTSVGSVTGSLAIGKGATSYTGTSDGRR